ncbi:MAG: polysaccharide deacetylase family protein, partial [Dehalococcoidia bacterium]
HDVDWPLCTAGRSWLHVAKGMTTDVLRYGDAGLARARLQSYRRTRRGSADPDLWNTFDHMMDVDERNGLRAMFYVIGGRTAGNLDGTYDLDDPWIRRLLRRIHDRGHEIGLHTSYYSSTDPARLSCELAALQEACRREGIEQDRWGGRQHWLRWDNPATWRYYDQAGLEYDSSLGCSHHAGFRASVCYEYPVFDLRSRRALALRERPLVAMEIAAFRGDSYAMEAVCERLVRLNRISRFFDGDFVLLWHNNSLVSDSQRLCFRTVVNAASGCRDGW